ncbi:hypothetical protein [Streptomyces sp. NPDC007100]|uniref:hypothetical protein n=1 Tax=Streptomyces sp. NPDC007100 TaxID=3155602 RepID=UPI0033EA1F71
MILSGFSRLPLRAVPFADGVFARLEGRTAQGVPRRSVVLAAPVVPSLERVSWTRCDPW